MKAFTFIYAEYNDYYQKYKWQPLDIAKDYYGIKVKENHNALEDAKATLYVFRKMIKEFK